MEQVNIWLDCDVGNDDAMAIILALFHPKSNLLGISSCFGNTNLTNCTNNTLRLLSSLGQTHIPVFRGSENSLKKTKAETEMHGSQGLFGAYQLIQTIEPVQDISLNDLIRKTTKGQKFTIVITGPQTNIAVLLREHPEICEQINEIIFMGGTSGFGNITPNAEYNIYSDPEAAQLMINLCQQHKIKLVMVSLDITYTCQLLEQQQQQIKNIGTKFSDWCLGMLQEYQEAYRSQDFEYPPIHDPVAVFYALHPEYFTVQPLYVEIECQSELCYGRTVIDKLNRLNKIPTVIFCKKVNVNQFWNQMIAAVEVASKNSKIE